MGTISIVFRVPVIDRLSDSNGYTLPGPYVCIRVDDRDPDRREECGHKHVKYTAAVKCARSMSLGEVFGAVNERVEIHTVENLARRDQNRVEDLVSAFFGGDMVKVAGWMTTINPTFGHMTPKDFAMFKGWYRLLCHVRTMLDENKRG